MSRRKLDGMRGRVGERRINVQNPKGGERNIILENQKGGLGGWRGGKRDLLGKTFTGQMMLCYLETVLCP